ncbi:MAG: hypothetical protein DMG34_03270 [Acidobacteria bacterium]|nr:MAG: hypothetical protein DMG34_03270 [Acidobacteriota bacterium]
MCDGVLACSCLKQDVAVLGQGFLCADGKTVQVAKRTHCPRNRLTAGTTAPICWTIKLPQRSMKDKE